MNLTFDALRGIAAWWREGLTKIGTNLLQAYDWPGGEPEPGSDADREAWKDERARLALSPWWL